MRRTAVDPQAAQHEPDRPGPDDQAKRRRDQADRRAHDRNTPGQQGQRERRDGVGERADRQPVRDRDPPLVDVVDAPLEREHHPEGAYLHARRGAAHGYGRISFARPSTRWPTPDEANTNMPSTSASPANTTAGPTWRCPT